MRISPHPQQSVEWMVERAGIVTCSELDQIVTPEFKARTGQMVETYLAKKVAERWTGGPLASLNVFDVEQGQILEEQAVPWYELEFSEIIQRVGLLTTDDGKIGCSPDGLIGEDCGIEIKCPAIHTHVRYLLDGEVPKDYLAQIHGAMLVTGRPMWKFLSYHRRLPALVKAVERDEKIQRRLADAIGAFNARLDEAFERMCDLNGGLPKWKAHHEAKADTAKTDITP